MRYLFFTVLVGALTFTYVIPSQAQHVSTHDREVVTISAEDYAFDAPDEIPSGWTTIEFTNQGEEPHLMYIERLPDGKSVDDYAAEVVGPRTEIWYKQRAGEIHRAETLAQIRAAFPEWRAGMPPAGGIGVVKPGHTLEVTLHFEPGSYILDCYMKTEDGEIHNMEGMVRELHVTETLSDMAPPDHDIEVTLSNHEMVVEGNLTPGRHTVQVHNKEVGHNVHMARLESDTEMQDIIEWITPYNLEYFWPPAPATFIGGIHYLPEGGTGYFTLELEQGRYLFISQTTLDHDVWQEVTIEP